MGILCRLTHKKTSRHLFCTILHRCPCLGHQDRFKDRGTNYLIDVDSVDRQAIQPRSFHLCQLWLWCLAFVVSLRWWRSRSNSKPPKSYGLARGPAKETYHPKLGALQNQLTWCSGSRGERDQPVLSQDNGVILPPMLRPRAARRSLVPAGSYNLSLWSWKLWFWTF